MLIINEKDIANAVQAGELIRAIEKAYCIQNEKSTNIPDRVHIEHDGNTLLLMPGFIETIFGAKLVSVFPKNLKRNLPTIYGTMILNEVGTGRPLAVIDGSKLTAMRTGAVGAAAVKHLAPKRACVLGIIGSGVQAFHQAILSIGQRGFQEVLIFDENIDSANLMQHKLAHLNIQVNISTDTNELVAKSDVIISATSSCTPVFEYLPSSSDEKLFVGIGSYKPDMQEFPLALFNLLNEIYVDTPFAKEESGDVRIPLEKGLVLEQNILEFSEIFNEGFKEMSKIRFFKSVGMSLFDLTVAELIYKNAQKLNLGTNVEF